MAEKNRILDALNEQALLLPSLVNRALVANDRVKYRFTLLQAAQAHAERPDAVTSSLRAERLAAGVQDGNLDRVVGDSERIGKGRYHIPDSSRIIREAYADAAEMLEPLRAAEIPESVVFAQRLQVFAMPDSGNDELAAGEIHAVTSGDRASGDSLHLLVMDMHRALNALQASLASETIDGCRAYGIRDADRALIAAFMEGINRTAPLKFDHPGLSATATRVGDKLVLQNDIGTTDAHVLVIHVAGRTATVTYTDVHLPRLLFFQSLFDGYEVEWQDTRSRKDAGMEDGVYHLCVGSYTSRSGARLREYLGHLGSRLVFLIDWNRARKRLRLFVPHKASIELLKWAADGNIGHMAWLKAGGEQLIFDAMSFAYGGQLRPGDRLDALLTETRAVRFLRFNLKQALEGLTQGRPVSLVADEIRTELASQVRSTEDAMLDTALEHAGLIVELADTVRAALEAAQAGRQREVAAMAERAKGWETAADLELNNARSTLLEGDNFVLQLMSEADDIADDLEEAVFHITLSPMASSRSIAALDKLVDPVAHASRELVKALAASRHARRGVPREDMDDFLQAVHAIRTMEHASDLAEREVKRALANDARPFSEVFGIVEAARNLEEAADGLMHVALLLRDHVMGKVIHA
ncbi:MAG: hypothetical protein IE917_07180 [Betaproteobacteria bacterium]|nr:hypothetical protein [Betaproteobacteria bacterium]